MNLDVIDGGDFKMIRLVFLPRQLASFDDLMWRLEGHEEIRVAPVELFDAFAQEFCRFGDFRQIRSVGTALAVLTRIAHDQLEMSEGPSEQEWVKIESVFGTDAIPATLGRVIMEAISASFTRGEISQPWHWLEVKAADELAR